MDSGVKLFVGGLPADITKEEVQVVFGTYGSVQDVHVMVGKSTSGQACSFVVYDRQQSADDAITSLDGIYSIREGEPPIQVKLAKQGAVGAAPAVRVPPPMTLQQFAVPAVAATEVPQVQAQVLAAPVVQDLAQAQAAAAAAAVAAWGQAAAATAAAAAAAPAAQAYQQIASQPRKLFVGNLPSDITQEALMIVFNSYGMVTNVHIMTGKSKSGQSCAFVEYSNAVEAQTAVVTLHEKYEIRPGDGPIVVKFASNQNRAAPY
mmetsp:Transcript_12237/g.27730  ORF Transcript_12237/g.27730 Transcript_12237/m.27730 type:complete len:262 (-) Transcript_12237:118-903(-)